MRVISFISSSKSCRFLAAVLLAAVAATEFTFSRVLPSSCYTHEVDKALYEIGREAGEADIVFIGDSVGGQMIDLAVTHGYGNGRWRNLATNQVIEMPGHYFVLRRYLARCAKKPRAVVFVGTAPESVNLDQYSDENYVQRCFLRWEEIAALTRAKGLRFGLVMAVHKFFPSYRYRNALQSKMLGFSNAEISTAASQASKAASGGPELYKIEGSLYDEYLHKLLDMLAREGIDFYYIFPPVSRSVWLEHASRYKALVSFLDSLRPAYPNFRYTGELRVYPDSYFYNDKLHILRGAKKVEVTRILLEEVIGSLTGPGPAVSI
ncbi:MAG: hypothetical protein ACM3L6_05120 [Deltaproteobacteria bacterium]